jgi:hypothetical protein
MSDYHKNELRKSFWQSFSIPPEEMGVTGTHEWVSNWIWSFAVFSEPHEYGIPNFRNSQTRTRFKWGTWKTVARGRPPEHARARVLPLTRGAGRYFKSETFSPCLNPLKP